eukprot:gene6392-9305_t
MALYSQEKSHGQAWFDERAQEWVRIKTLSLMPSALKDYELYWKAYSFLKFKTLYLTFYPIPKMSTKASKSTLKKDIDSGRSMSDLSVLEVGAGTGLLSIALARDCKKIVCVEPSENMTNQLKQKATSLNLGNISVIGESLESMNQLEGLKFDIAVMSLTLHHVEDVDHLCSIISQSLRPSGLFMVFDFEKFDGSESFHDMTEEEMQAAGVHHRSGFSADDLANLFSRTGLNCIYAKSEFTMKMPLKREHEGTDHHHHHHRRRKGHGEHGNIFPIIFAVGKKDAYG